MRIEIDIDVANDPNAHRWLDRILHKVEDGWHVWDTTSEADPEVFRTTMWIGDRGRQGRLVDGMLVGAIKHAAWSLAPHGRRLRVTTDPRTADEATPENAARLAEEPLTVLVENRFSDGPFVERVAKEIDYGLRRLWDRAGAPVRFDSVGGVGQMIEEVERRVNGAAVRPRLVVVVDSDRRYPGAAATQAARKLCRRCEKLDVPCWLLAKRESENYLPRVLLSERESAGVEHHQLVEVWDDLSDDQKDFFDMKDGLPVAPSGKEEELFRGLCFGSRTILTHGFGGNVYKCWECWNVQARTELLNRGRGDLEHGITLIRKEV